MYYGFYFTAAIVPWEFYWFWMKMLDKQHAALFFPFLLCGMKICAGGFRIPTPFTCF